MFLYLLKYALIKIQFFFYILLIFFFFQIANHLALLISSVSNSLTMISFEIRGQSFVVRFVFHWMLLNNFDWYVINETRDVETRLTTRVAEFRFVNQISTEIEIRGSSLFIFESSNCLTNYLHKLLLN